MQVWLNQLLCTGKNVFNRENPDKDMEEKILELRSVHKDYGYRRIHAELCNQGHSINKKKVQRIIKN